MKRLIHDFDEAALDCRERYGLCLQLLDWKDAAARHRVRFQAARQIRKELAVLTQTSGGEECLSLVHIAMLLGAAGAIPQYRAEEIREEQIERLIRRIEDNTSDAQASYLREILESVHRTKFVKEDLHMGWRDKIEKIGNKLEKIVKKKEPQVDKHQELLEKQRSLIEQIKEKTREIRKLKIELNVTTDKNDKAMLEQKIERLTAKRGQMQRNFEALGDVIDAQLTAELVADEAAFMAEITDQISVYDDEKADETMTEVEVKQEYKEEVKNQSKGMRKRLEGYTNTEEEEEEEYEDDSEAEEIVENEEEKENA